MSSKRFVIWIYIAYFPQCILVHCGKYAWFELNNKRIKSSKHVSSTKSMFPIILGEAGWLTKRPPRLSQAFSLSMKSRGSASTGRICLGARRSGSPSSLWRNPSSGILITTSPSLLATFHARSVSVFWQRRCTKYSFPTKEFRWKVF